MVLCEKKGDPVSMNLSDLPLGNYVIRLACHSPDLRVGPATPKEGLSAAISERGWNPDEVHVRRLNDKPYFPNGLLRGA